MLGMTAMLSDQDIADLTAYYSQQPETQETTAPEIAEPGQKLYMGGDIKRGILACTACHGPRGMGLELAKFPKISSQHPAYIKLQLEKFRTKARNNDTNSMMTDVAAKENGAEANYVTHTVAKVGDRVVMEVSTSEFVSKDPTLKFQVKANGIKSGDKIEVTWADKSGKTGNISGKVK